MIKTISEIRHGLLYNLIEDDEKQVIYVDDIKELIRRNKMDDDELKWNKTHPDWNKALLLIENALSKNFATAKTNSSFTTDCFFEDCPHSYGGKCHHKYPTEYCKYRKRSPS